tara:strand:- start:91292 stop:91576 length:285 start_codon:yes stop_codon:yes gene_type:complete
MGSFSDDFLTLGQNTRLLIQKNKHLEERLNKTKRELDELKKRSVLQDEEIKKLVEKNKILRIAGASNEGSSREVKFKINEIVREVDKCIAQLNQ